MPLFYTISGKCSSPNWKLPTRFFANDNKLVLTSFHSENRVFLSLCCSSAAIPRQQVENINDSQKNWNSIQNENRTFQGQRPGSYQRWSKAIVGISTRNNAAFGLRKRAVSPGHRCLKLLLKSVLHYVIICINDAGRWPSKRLKIHRWYVISVSMAFDHRWYQPGRWPWIQSII